MSKRNVIAKYMLTAYNTTMAGEVDRVHSAITTELQQTTVDNPNRKFLSLLEGMAHAYLSSIPPEEPLNGLPKTIEPTVTSQASLLCVDDEPQVYGIEELEDLDAVIINALFNAKIYTIPDLETAIFEERLELVPRIRQVRMGRIKLSLNKFIQNSAESSRILPTEEQP